MVTQAATNQAARELASSLFAQEVAPQEILDRITDEGCVKFGYTPEKYRDALEVIRRNSTFNQGTVPAKDQ